MSKVYGTGGEDLAEITKRFVIAYIAHVKRAGGDADIATMKTVYDKGGKPHIVAPVDAEEYVKSGRYTMGGLVSERPCAPKWAQDRLDKLARGKLSAPHDHPELVKYTRGHRNTALLIEYLRGIARDGLAPALEPVLAILIADALDRGWKKRPPSVIESNYLRQLRDNIKTMLEEGSQDAAALALELGATLKKRAKAADAIAVHLMGLSGPRALNSLLYPRAGRGKKG
jgi:hypothetical protein